LVWLTKCFGAGCGKSLARVLLKEAVVVLGCRFCVPRAVNTVFKAKKKKKKRGVGDSALRGKYHDREPLAFRSPKKIRLFFVRTHQSYAVTKKARFARREIFCRVR
jgi:hypothetical protein